MRQNPSFTLADVAEIRRVVDANPWATITSHGPEGLVSSHYVVLLDDERDDLTVVGHVGRPDDLIHGLGERELLVVFQGPHGYISPGWYGDVPSVPTWNYTAVHLAGVPEILTDEENLAVLDRLVDRFEGRMPEPRRMWERPNDPAFIARLAAGTVGFRLTPSRVVAKRKLSQNKPGETVDAVIAELEGEGPYAQPELAAEMRRAQQQRAGATP
ncbi:FMN-binding negative transcriptional regulator [uncultured Microbacterium sp.]|uniref:FMN-binding negative transcriptional regulator n=1 Tax=uncultured Microbacterium sp. TaxID=191216 RepID=UPI0028D327D0|nr:FMN-binding negative transcriptional regulator [uncultured Microbacterium sp.]